MPIRADVQKPYPGAKVTLYQLDCTPIGGAVFHFTSSVREGGPIIFDGKIYSPIAITADGWEITSKGFPTPTLSMGSQLFAIIAAQFNLGDLIGAQVKRIRTFEHYLDDGDMPDPSQVLPIDIYEVNRRSKTDPQTISWELRASADVENAVLPRRMATPNYCSARYRWWDPAAGAWQYTGECPYAGAAMYSADNRVATDPTKDVCSKTLTGCILRFGVSQPIPFWGFPGARD